MTVTVAVVEAVTVAVTVTMTVTKAVTEAVTLAEAVCFQCNNLYSIIIVSLQDPKMTLTTAVSQSSVSSIVSSCSFSRCLFTPPSKELESRMNYGWFHTSSTMYSLIVTLEPNQTRDVCRSSSKFVGLTIGD